jgi:predicted alpha/beta-fold hydrolase
MSQIVANDAIPYGEFKQNPYAILCTTSLGGHLSWFELGGHRWHSKPVRLHSPHALPRDTS